MPSLTAELIWTELVTELQVYYVKPLRTKVILKQQAAAILHLPDVKSSFVGERKKQFINLI